jgi:beta-galactosidase
LIQAPRSGSLPGATTGFVEGPVAAGAEILASYEHPHLGRWAAVTTRAVRAGRITVVGTVPDQGWEDATASASAR